MTKINKIVMHGFKSFAKRTELLFDDSFNVVLGPNGSGKSNLLDALCFVLGKSSSKSLRAEKASNLIYNGGKTKQPSKHGEVSIFFDNANKVFPTDDKVIKLTRLVRQNGQSVYKINDKVRTRQQILDLMSIAKINPDGYNIILQGDIVRFAEMHPVERRQVIEEIAGISIYEEKKRKAINELDKVGERLKEAEIVLTERTIYLNELKKDRDQAVKFKNLKDKISQNKATFLHLRIQEKLKEKKKFDDSLWENQTKIDAVSQKIKKLKDDVKEKKAQIEEINKKVEESGEKEQLALHKEVEKLKVGLETDKQRISNCQNEIKRITSRKEQLEKDSKDMNEKIKEMNSEIKRLTGRKELKLKEEKDIEAKISKFKEKYRLENTGEIEARIDKIDKEADEKLKGIQELREQQQNLLREKDKMEFQIQSLAERVKKVLEVQKENKTQIDSLKTKKDDFKKATSELSTCLSEDSSLAVQLSGSTDKLSKLRDELSKLNARNIGVEERAAGTIAVQKILEQKNSLKGVYGTVAQLGDVSSKYSSALEVAAGSRINSIIVDTDATAAKCIKYLREKKLGTATFLPLNKIKTREITAEHKRLAKTTGSHGLALDLINFDKKFANAFSHVFGSTIIVDNIDVARRIGVGAIRMATIDGDLAEGSGAMHGGYRVKKGTGFKEKELTSEIANLESQVLKTESLVSTLEKRRKENEQKISSLREKKATLEGEVIKLEKSLHLEDGDLDASKRQEKIIGNEIEKLEKQIKEVQTKLTADNKALADFKIEKQELRDKVNKLRDPTLIAELNTFGQKKQELREEIISIGAELKGMETQIKDIFSRDQENSLKILKQQEKEAEDFAKEINTLKEKLTKQEVALKKKEEDEKKFYGQFRGLFTKRGKLNEEMQKIEIQIIQKEEDIRDVEHKNNSFSIENARINAEMSGLQEEFKQYEGVKVLANKGKDELKKEINDFEKMVDTIGVVNLRALEIYEKIEKEHKELLGKKDKLVKEKDDIVGMMQEIDSKKKDLFMNTFNIIKDNFQRIFGALTTKGEAHLVLDNPEDPFEGGLEFKVRISGNKFLDIRGLSGGEKTLTALAFIFSIQEHDPASFYVLDEVDAALDKHNSEKFGQLINKYSKKAQYVVISHNDAVITEASSLYGVSMDEHGISNVVSLKI